MRKQIVTELIKDFHEEEPPSIIDRDLVVGLPKVKKAITIIGPRRAGKTFFLYNLMERIEKKERTEMLYIDLEDDRLLPLKLSDLDSILKTYYEIYPKNKQKKVYLFFDEIQNVEKWELFVRRVLDTENAYIFLSGSSSKLLAKEIATSMRGRAITHIILPFSFKEYLRVNDFELEKYLSSNKRSWLMKHIDQYIEWGGFPEVVLETDEDSRLKTLKDYVEIMLMRDIAERHRVKNIRVLRMLFSALQTSYSKEFSIHKFYNFLKSQGIKVSKNTLYQYFQHFEDAFAVIPVHRFSYSLRKTQQSLPKVYLIDNGYVHLSGTSRSHDMGRLMENVVAVECFRRMSQNPRLEMYYWKDNGGKEVDFVIKDGKKVQELIQVCYDVESFDTKLRETKSLIMASKDLKCKKLKIITWDHEDQETLEGKKIQYISLWKWLLDLA